MFISWFEEHVLCLFFLSSSFVLFFFLFHLFLLFVHSKLFFTPYYFYFYCLLFVVLSYQLPFIDVNLCFHSFVFVWCCLFMLSHYFLFMFFLCSIVVVHPFSLIISSCSSFKYLPNMLLFVDLALALHWYAHLPPFCFLQIWEWEVNWI
jgi:hypothetical protein